MGTSSLGIQAFPVTLARVINCAWVPVRSIVTHAQLITRLYVALAGIRGYEQYKPAVHYMHGARGAIHYVYRTCKGDRALALTTACLRGTTRGIAGQWRVYILKCGWMAQVRWILIAISAHYSSARAGSIVVGIRGSI